MLTSVEASARRRSAASQKASRLVAAEGALADGQGLAASRAVDDEAHHLGLWAQKRWGRAETGRVSLFPGNPETQGSRHGPTAPSAPRLAHTWRPASKPTRRTKALGKVLAHFLHSASTWSASVAPYMGSFHMLQ
jgi:hypothetical protein